MARYTGPKHKISRRVGYCLWGMAKSPANRRPYPPGQHGNKAGGRRKESNYSRQLLEKQKLRSTYGVLEKQFRRTFQKASSLRGNTGDNFLSMLESRLDSVVYRAGIAPTVWSARQLVAHGHIQVNGKKVDVPSYHVKAGSLISVREKSRKMDLITRSLETAPPPPVYMEVYPQSFEAKLLETPAGRDVPVKVDMAQIVEFYSR
jgi:small subunit ribosomal protein S4